MPELDARALDAIPVLRETGSLPPVVPATASGTSSLGAKAIQDLIADDSRFSETGTLPPLGDLFGKDE